MALALSSNQIRDKLRNLSKWTLNKSDKLEREFKFKDFTSAFTFMTEVAAVAEKMDHHPEWFNVYNRVKVELTTHSAKGLSDLDFQLAAEMDKIAGNIIFRE